MLSSISVANTYKYQVEINLLGILTSKSAHNSEVLRSQKKDLSLRDRNSDVLRSQTKDFSKSSLFWCLTNSEIKLLQEFVTLTSEKRLLKEFIILISYEVRRSEKSFWVVCCLGCTSNMHVFVNRCIHSCYILFVYCLVWCTWCVYCV